MAVHPCDVAALEDGLLTVSAVVEDLSQIRLWFTRLAQRYPDARVTTIGHAPCLASADEMLHSAFVSEIVVLFATDLTAKRIVEPGE